MKDEPHTRPSTLSEGIESDYASTTTSPKLDNRFSMGGDFSTMFSGVGNRKSAMALDVENVQRMSESPTVSFNVRRRQRNSNMVSGGFADIHF
jgi:hypothetical protein